MRNVQLLYAANEITEQDGFSEQRLFFLIRVKNLSFKKQIDIIWSGADGVWHTLPARFHNMAAHDDKEHWIATATFHSTADTPLPRTILYAVRYRVKGEEYWDRNSGHNYFVPVNASFQCSTSTHVLNLGFQHRLGEDQHQVPITIAVNSPLQAQQVRIHWTTDDWQHSRVTDCQLKTCLTLEHGKHIIEGGTQIWSALLDTGSAFRLQYAICCESDNEVVWANNHGRNYRSSHKPLNVLALNLHCRQEDNQDDKFSQIAQAIDELHVDVVCLQEVSEDWNDMRGNWETNSAKIINDRLKQPFHIHTDWSHLGFDRYREGVAILSRHPIAEYDARYMSNDSDPYSINSRKGVMGQIPIPWFGRINFFSVHTSWWDGGFEEQFHNLRNWAESWNNDQVKATMLCGDFNIAAGSRGYQLVVNSSEYEDEFLAVTSPKVFTKIFHKQQDNWPRYLAHDGRIDYIWKDRSSALRPIAARFIFTPQEYGRVSDHEGLLLTFEMA